MDPISGRPPLSPPGEPMNLDRRQPVVRSRDHVDPQIREAAEGMEAMFLDYMMKVMRETVPKNEFSLENQATGIYRGMLDSEIAQRAAKNNSIGLADQIIAYLEARSYNQRQGKATEGRNPRTGGTDAGQFNQRSEHAIRPNRAAEEVGRAGEVASERRR